MKQIITKAMRFVAVCGAVMGIGAHASAMADSNNSSQFATRLPGLTKEWRHTTPTPLSQRISPLPTTTPGTRHIVTGHDKQLPLADTFGTLYLPNGDEWTYTATYTYTDGYAFDSATFTIYDQNLQPVATFTDHFELGEGETGINYVALNPNVTRKFFHINDAYEVMVYVHATTEDYMGHIYTHVFSLGTPDPVCTIEGDAVLMVNMAEHSWEEDYYMVFLSEEFGIDESQDPESQGAYTYFQNFNVYKKAAWGGNGPQLLHTFAIDYQSISGAGENMIPVIPVKHDGRLYYVLPHYEKPYFDPSVPVWEEPVVMEDNKFIIDMYDDQFQLIKTTTIPMEVEEGFLYTFPEMGGLMYTEDVSFGKYTTGDDPAYIVTFENYDPTVDDYVSSYYIYDVNGQVINTIIEDSFDCLYLSDIPGQEPQFCFLDLADETFTMVDIYSCRKVAQIPLNYDGYNLSTTLDRVPAGSAYEYAVSMSNGELAPDGVTVMHRVAYFDNNGRFTHWEDILMGENVVMAQPYIAGAALNPYLFNTDSKREYMVLVKENDNPAVSSVAVERFYVINTDGEKLLCFEPGDNGILSAIWLQNLGTHKPLLGTAYRDADWRFTLSYNTLPLTGNTLQGEGTESNPYLIASAGDMLLIDEAPGAHYRVVDDLDFSGMVWQGTAKPFTGVFDGQGHAIFNLVVSGPGLFSSLMGGAQVKDLDIVNPVLVPSQTESGIITGYTVYEGSVSPVISGINIFAPTINSDTHADEVGCIAGYIATMTTITDCAVFDADIYLPRAMVGGIVGREITGSSVSRCYFGGTIEAASAGGIVGSAETAAVAAANCHVNADIKGVRRVGGIAGAMEQERGYRPQVVRCYVEGSLTATAANDPAIGGIAGALAEVVYDDEVVSINSCVVNAQISFNASADKATAHRIVGHTVDVDKIIDWDNIQPGMTEEEYPYLDLHETLLANNYAAIDLIDGNYADDPASIEGATIAPAELTQDFFESLGYQFGESAAAPWQMGDDGLVLYLEDAEAPEVPGHSGITDTLVNGAITLDGRTVRADGQIAVYSTSGVKVAAGHGLADLSRLPAGVYIISARTAAGPASLKVTIK